MGDGRRLRIIVVGANEATRRGICSVAEGGGVEIVAESASPGDALRLLRTAIADAVVLDVEPENASAATVPFVDLSHVNAAVVLDVLTDTAGIIEVVRSRTATSEQFERAFAAYCGARRVHRRGQRTGRPSAGTDRRGGRGRR